MTRHSPVVALLIQAHEQLQRSHMSNLGAIGHTLARDIDGVPCCATAPDAQYFTTVGMLIKLDPVPGRHPKGPNTGNVGHLALDALQRAAEEQGYFADMDTTVYVDRQGVLAVSRMFKRAIQLAEIDEPENRRRSQRTAGQGHGQHPRGATA